MRVSGEQGQSTGRWRLRSVLVATLGLTLVPGVWAQRSNLKPPWNAFPPARDVQLGKQNAQMLAKRLPLCNDAKVDEYLTKLGLRLVSKMPTRGVQYPWEFHCVNDKE